MGKIFALAVGLAAAVAPGIALAQAACCALPEVRTTNDCDAAGDRCLTIGDTATVAFGGEIRTRYEAFDEPNFGIGGAPDYEAIAARALLSADFRSSNGVRAFVQLSSAQEDGRRPGPRPFDESEPDFAQAFVDLPIGRAGSVRVGRQELAIGNRLVTLRDGVTLRRSFDGARVDLRIAGSTATAFVVQPVLTRPDVFDDKRTPGERFAGLSWQFPGTPAEGVWTAFLFDRERDFGSYAQVSGPERRQTLGVRYARTTESFDVAAQIAGQVGDVAGVNVRAYGGVVDFGWRPDIDRLTRYGVVIGIASGDGDRNDDTLGTFDPLYPNLNAYSDALISYYANEINIQGNVSRAFGPVTLRFDATLLARHRTDDALYAPPGQPLAQPLNSSRLSAVLLEGSARWRVSPRVEIYASVLRGEPLDGVEAVGGKAATFALLQVTTGF